MKNQYFADRNDYFKYDLLIFLAEQLAGNQKLSVVWMLTGNDKSNDGGSVSYIRGAGSKLLFDFLQASLKEQRQVTRLKEYFAQHYPVRTGVGFSFNSYGDEVLFKNQERKIYFEKIPKDHLQSAVIFLDPDNGLEVKSAKGKDLHKYVRFDEVQSVYNRMSTDSCLVVYQHSRHVPLTFLVYGLAYQLRELLSCPIPLAITDNRVAFLIVAKDSKRREEVSRLIHQYSRTSLHVLD